MLWRTHADIISRTISSKLRWSRCCNFLHLPLRSLMALSTVCLSEDKTELKCFWSAVRWPLSLYGVISHLKKKMISHFTLWGLINQSRIQLHFTSWYKQINRTPFLHASSEILCYCCLRRGYPPSQVSIRKLICSGVENGWIAQYPRVMHWPWPSSYDIKKYHVVVTDNTEKKYP